MRIVFLITAILITSLHSHSQNASGIEPAKHYFGISLQPSPQDLITFAIVTVNEKGEKTVSYLSRRSFIRQMIGFEESIANPSETNLLKEAGIDGPEVFDNLWKLRYAEAPYKSDNSEEGWARNKFRPSDEQMNMLKAFGIEIMSDFFYGDNLIALLKAMTNDQWVSEYFGK